MGCKYCAWGKCKNNSRKLDKNSGIFFIPFRKPNRKYLEDCKIWVAACSRKNFTIKNVNRNTYICSLHFVGGKGPTKEFPHPIPVHVPSAREDESPPAKRGKKSSVTGSQRRKILRSPLPDEIPNHISEYIKDGYSEGICQNLMLYRIKQKFCDVILRVVNNNKLYKAHTLVLSAASPFFEELFENPKHSDNRSLILSLPEYIDCDGLEPILSYIYSGRLIITYASAVRIYQVAWLFKMDDVLTMCQQFFRKYDVPQQAVDVASEHVILQKDFARTDAKENPVDESAVPNVASQSPAVNISSSTPIVSLPSKSQKIINRSTKPIETQIQRPVVEIPMRATKKMQPAPVTIPVSQTTKFPVTLTKAPATQQIIGVCSIVKPVTPVTNPTVSVPPFPGVPNNRNNQAQGTTIGRKVIVNPTSLIPRFVPPHNVFFQSQQNAFRLPSSIPVTLAISSAKQELTGSRSQSAETVKKTDTSKGGDVSMTLPGKPSTLYSIPKEVLQQINHTFKVNGDAGKSSRVFFIKAPQRMDNEQNLLTALADTTKIDAESSAVVDASKKLQNEEVKEQPVVRQSATEQQPTEEEESQPKLDVHDSGVNRRLGIADEIAKFQASNAETEEMLSKQSNENSKDTDYADTILDESVEISVEVDPGTMTMTGSPCLEQSEEEDEAFIEGYVKRRLNALLRCRLNRK